MKKTITTFSLIMCLTVLGFMAMPHTSEAKIRFHVDLGLGISSGYNSGYYPYDNYGDYRPYGDYTGYRSPYERYGYNSYPTMNNYGYSSYYNDYYSPYTTNGYSSNYYNSSYGYNSYRYLPTCDYC